MPKHATVTFSRMIPGTPADTFAHWIDPAARQRFEASPESGMEYQNFDTRLGGTEIIHIVNNGTQIGEITQRFVGFAQGDYICTQMQVMIGGAVQLLVQATVTFRAEGGSTKIAGTSQTVDFSGADQNDEQEKGWAQMLKQFAQDFADYGPNSSAQKETQ